MSVNHLNRNKLRKIEAATGIKIDHAFTISHGQRRAERPIVWTFIGADGELGHFIPATGEWKIYGNDKTRVWGEQA